MDILSFIMDLIIVLFFVAVASPLFAWTLLNDPKRPNAPHAFTRCQPNEAKRIVRGGNFVRMIMNSRDLRFKGRNSRYNLTKPGDEASLWEVETEASTTFERAGVVAKNPWTVSFLGSNLTVKREYLNPWNWYKAYMYKTGFIVVGIPFFQSVLQSELPRIELVTDEGGREKPQKRDDISDHLIVRDDTWPIMLTDVETADLISLTFILSLQVGITNPYRATYMVNKWYEILQSTTRDHLLTIVGNYSVEDILSSMDYTKEDSDEIDIDYTDLFRSIRSNREQMKKEIQEKLEAMIDRVPLSIVSKTDKTVSEESDGVFKDETSGEFYRSLRNYYGIYVSTVQINDIIPPEDIQESLSQPTRSRLAGRATIFDGVAEAEYLDRVADTVHKHGNAGLIVQQYRALVEGATAAGTKEGNLVFMSTPGNDSGMSPESALLLQSLQKLVNAGVTPAQLEKAVQQESEAT